LESRKWKQNTQREGEREEEGEGKGEQRMPRDECVNSKFEVILM